MEYLLPEELYTDEFMLKANSALVPKKDLSALSPDEQRQAQLDALRSLALEGLDENETAKARDFYGERVRLEKSDLGRRLTVLLDPSLSAYTDPASYYRRRGWDYPKGEKTKRSEFFDDLQKRFIAATREQWREKKRQEEEEEEARAEAYWKAKQAELATQPPPPPNTLKNWVDAGIDALPCLTALFVVGVYTFRNRERERLGHGVKRVWEAVCRPVRRFWRWIPAEDWLFWLAMVGVGACAVLAYGTAMWSCVSENGYLLRFKFPFWVYRLTHWAVAICAAVSFFRLLRAETTAPPKRPFRTLAALALLVVYQPVFGVVSFKQEEWAWVNAVTVLLLPFCAWRKKVEKNRKSPAQ